VAGGPQLVGEGEESIGLSLCVVKQQDLGHGATLIRAVDTARAMPELVPVRPSAGPRHLRGARRARGSGARGRERLRISLLFIGLRRSLAELAGIALMALATFLLPEKAA